MEVGHGDVVLSLLLLQLSQLSTFFDTCLLSDYHYLAKLLAKMGKGMGTEASLAL